MAVRLPPQKKSFKKGSILKLTGLWIIFPLLLSLLFLLLFIWAAGKKLIQQDDFNHTEWAVVLAGQSSDCERTDAAVELFNQDKIDFLLISSIPFCKNRFTSEYLLPEIFDQGVPEKNVFEIRHYAQSTIDEAITIIKQMRLLGIDTALIVTSNFHSARSKSIFNRLSGGNPHYIVHPAAYDIYDSDAWWSSRQSRKIFLLETLKRIASFIEVTRKNSKSPLQSAAQKLLIQPEKNLPEKYNSGFIK